MIERFFVDTCFKLTTTRNAQGEQIEASRTPFSCRFRYINTFQEGQNLESITSDALLHAPADASLQQGNVISYVNRFGNTEQYTIETVTEARRGGSTVVEFLKCNLKRQYGES